MVIVRDKSALVKRHIDTVIPRMFLVWIEIHGEFSIGKERIGALSPRIVVKIGDRVSR